MQYPLADFLDRISIVRLKKQRIGGKSFQDQYDFLIGNIKNYTHSLQERFQCRGPGLISVDRYIIKLYQVNGKIWDLQSDIRKGKQGLLGLQQVGRRAIAIRQLNNKRVAIKNQVVQQFGGFLQIKKDHASE